MNEEKTEKEVTVKSNVSVTITVSGYVPGMEKDAEFIGCSFRRVTPYNSTQVKERDAARTQLSADICKKYNVKPLGATSAPAGGVTKAIKAAIGALLELTTDFNKITKVINKKFSRNFTSEELQTAMK